jgi:galactokinase
METPFGGQRDTIRLAVLFSERFGDATGAVVARAPGRVNLIGEHTDYNDGFVLPVIIDRHAEVIARRRSDRRVRLYAFDLDEACEVDLDQPIDSTGSGWLPYVLGVVHELVRREKIDRGVDLVFRSTVPIGAGLSSSAAIEVATALALDAAFKLWLDPVETALLCQEVEHRYAGVRCGIMDQFSSRLGQPEQALFIDCRSVEARHVPLSLDGHRLVIIDSGVRRELADSRYNDRRSECEEAVAVLSTEDSSITSLRDVTSEVLADNKSRLTPKQFSRARHVVSENERVLEACACLASGDLATFGRLMNASHLSLRDDYEVSHPALDRLVERALRVDGVLGARLTGAGFGGCTVHLVREAALPELEHKLGECVDDWASRSIIVGKPEEARITEIVA